MYIQSFHQSFSADSVTDTNLEREPMDCSDKVLTAKFGIFSTFFGVLVVAVNVHHLITQNTQNPDQDRQKENVRQNV